MPLIRSALYKHHHPPPPPPPPPRPYSYHLWLLVITKSGKKRKVISLTDCQFSTCILFLGD